MILSSQNCKFFKAYSIFLNHLSLKKQCWPYENIGIIQLEFCSEDKESICWEKKLRQKQMKTEEKLLLFRIKHLCKLGYGVTNLILTLQTISFNRVHKGNRKKFLTHPITDSCFKLGVLPLCFSPKLPWMHLLHLQRENFPSTILYMYI